MKNVIGYILFLLFLGSKLSFSQTNPFTKEDTLLGSNTSYRSWWDVKHYDLSFKPDYTNKTISGNIIITYQVNTTLSTPVMQIDLQEPLIVDSLFYEGSKFMNVKQEGNRWMLSLPEQEKKSEHRIRVFYHGKPKVARNPPWDGGLVWKKDSLGNPWISIACQGAGASVWFPCKDLQADEPDHGARLSIIVPDTLKAIGNGKLISVKTETNGLSMYVWEVKNTINPYDIIPYIGKYTLVKDSITGEKGKLYTDYWVLNYHQQKVTSHLKPNVIKMMKCFEYWFGPYPFYEDSYKLVEAPFLGMEHQSNVAYGNMFVNGYLGRDLSRTGWGLKWDFIVVHESGHEWFGNSITARDVADNWIHEGFTSYSEVLFTECEFGKEAGNDYCEGVRKSIDNDIPLIGKYEVRVEGSGDIYNKGSNVVHMIRQVINNDEQFRKLLRSINETFYHKAVSSEELEKFISKKTGIDLITFFDQYLRTIQIPKLEYRLVKGKLSFRYVNCIPGFNMPVKITALGKEIIIRPTTQWQIILVSSKAKDITLNRNVYVDLIK
jgi:aminopeptidase N